MVDGERYASPHILFFLSGTPGAVIGFRSTRLFVLQRKGYCGGREEKNATAGCGCAGMDLPLDTYFEHPVVVHAQLQTAQVFSGHPVLVTSTQRRLPSS